jgi:hypothetical protein
MRLKNVDERMGLPERRGTRLVENKLVDWRLAHTDAALAEVMAVLVASVTT